MINLANNIYKITITPKSKFLINLGYRYYSNGGNGNDLYIYRFPIYKYKKYTVIEGELITECETGVTTLNVYDKHNMTKYPPFYSIDAQKQYDNKFLAKMDNTISNKFKELGVIKIPSKN